MNKRNILSAFATVLIILILIAVFHDYSSGHLESDKKGFTAFAEKELNNYQLYERGKSSDVYIEHGEDFSLAVRKNHIRQDSIAQYRDRKIQEIIDSCDKENIRALIIDSDSFTSDNGVISVYITYREYIVKDRKLSFYHSNVDTYMFDGNKEIFIEPVQAFRKTYKNCASDFADEYLETTFNKSQLNGAYKQYTENTEDNFSKFIVDGSKFVFFFDEGTVADGSYGTVSMLVPAMLMNDVQRKGIIDRYIDPEKPMVALTYDDGPGGEAEMQILDALYENSAVATFFYVGYRMSYSPETAVRATKIGCEIGNHSWDHPQYSRLTEKEVKEQIERTNTEIEKTTGVVPKVARPPYGDYNATTIKTSQLPLILWEVDTRDWASRNPQSVFEAVKKPDSLDGKIILMHSLYPETAQATRLILPWLKEQGYQTVTVSELIKYKTGKEPEQGKLYRKLK